MKGNCHLKTSDYFFFFHVPVITYGNAYRFSKQLNFQDDRVCFLYQRQLHSEDVN